MSGDLSGFSMMELFRMEAESHTATLSAGLVALEGTSALPEVIEPLMRAAHSLKGAARIVGLDAAVQIAHAMEDCFVAAQKGKLVLQPEHVDILLQGVDVLIRIAQIGEAEVEAWQSRARRGHRHLGDRIDCGSRGKGDSKSGASSIGGSPVWPGASVFSSRRE